ncbi:MAG: hypothetical protein RSD76_04450, partial [Clostridia bacterium]
APSKFIRIKGFLLGVRAAVFCILFCGDVPVWGAVPTPVARKAISAIPRSPRRGMQQRGKPFPHFV